MGWRSQRGVLALLMVLVLGLAAAWGLTQCSPGEDSASATATRTPGDDDSTTEPSASPSPTPTPTTSGGVPCEDKDTLFNVEGVEQDSLLPDCGEPPVTAAEQKKSGLGLGCGGSYPVILYKTKTADSQSSICGVDASGAKLRVVVAPDGGEPLDLAGSYDYQLDAFVAYDGDTTYIVQAYNGSIVTETSDGTDSEPSVEWSSLDNESDGEVDPKDL